jgi:hypothetical protein
MGLETTGVYPPFIASYFGGEYYGLTLRPT